MSNPKEALLQAIEQAPTPVLEEALHYLQYLIERYLDALELQEDLEDARAALQEAATEGTIAWEDLKAEIGLP